MLSFENDYSEGAHEKILQAFAQTNMEKLSGYGSDKYCELAKEKIRDACGCPEADIQFLVGGTQTNQVVIDGLLTKYEGVVAAATGHISTHEAGAIEYSGHKVLELPAHDGKIAADELEILLRNFHEDANYEHMVFPGMVYISYPTEYGTLYAEKELEEIHVVCRKYRIPLYIDGARLGYGLMSKEADMTLKKLAALCDVFYIGGTKVGALCGEAVVFSGRPAPAHFLTIVKQHGALLAKGRVLGIQFATLFTDDLYWNISRNAIDMAEEMKKIFREKGYRFYNNSPTNQIFIILPNDKMEKLQREVKFSFWEKYDDTHTVVRFATSWATTMEDVKKLEKLL